MMNNIRDEKSSVSLLMVGDIILDEPDAEQYFDFCRDTLKAGDFVIGHVEVPHTTRGTEQSTDIPAPPADPANLGALKTAGFNVATLAGNHIHDSGLHGIEDTITTLNNLGVSTTGAGINLTAAKYPAIVEKKGLKLGVLSYNCVGPREGWATSNKAGCAYVQVLTHYELEQATPGATPAIFTFANPESVTKMSNDIKQLRQQCDIVVVSLHKGVVHTPAHIEMYEYPVSYAAIDAGADIVLGHHAHIARGIEIYNGKPIYHGLGNFVTVTHALSTFGNDSPERLAWANKREKLFGFKPDGDMPFYPFHPESRNSMIAYCTITNSGLEEIGYLPVYIDKQGRPHIVHDDIEGKAVFDYIAEISKTAGLKTRYEWNKGWVSVGV